MSRRLEPYSQTFQSGELGPLLRALREHRALTLRECAEELGVSASALSQAERNLPGVERLALRAVNEHLARAADKGTLGLGHVRHQFQAYGSAKDILREVRAPERERRAGLLRQALLARDLPSEYGSKGFYVHVSSSSLRVELDNMSVYIHRHFDEETRGFINRDVFLGRVVDVDDDALDDEVWARSINRFASALVTSSVGGHFDAYELTSALQSPLPETPPPTNPNALME